MGTELRARVVGSAVTLVIVALLIGFAGVSWVRPLVGVAVLLIVEVGLWEYYALARLKGYLPPTRFGLVASFFHLFVTYLAAQGILPPFSQVVAIGALFLILFLLSFGSSAADRIGNLGVGFFGLFYVTVGFSTLLNVLYLNGQEPITTGQWWLVFLLAVTIFTDVAAYFVGKRFGQRKLAPRLSPGKTWAGAVGGMGGALLAGLIMGLLGSHLQPFKITVVLALFLGVVAQLGDLAESLLKRDAGVKDSNRLPGLGGVLDVVDGLLFVVPVGFAMQHLMSWSLG